jgi:hypothetical protein
MKPRLIATALLMATACNSPTGTSDPGIRIHLDDGALLIENRSARRTFYFIHESSAAVVIDWVPCVDLPDCPSLGPGERVEVPFDEIGGFSPDKTAAIVWWWRAVPGPGRKPIPGPIESATVRLQGSR